jgi:hypothetical protein
MEPQRWAAIESLYHAALAKDAGERSSYLRAACAEDQALRDEVESLLAYSGLQLSHRGLHPEITKLWEQIATVPAAARAAAVGAEYHTDAAFPNTARFACLDRLGAGTFGVVYRAFDRERSQVVALKKLLLFDSARLLRFKREFRSLVDLVHPNLVQLYELFGDDRQWFFTMELVPGLDFVSYVRPAGMLDWDRLRDALHQLAIGVQALHSSARLHRDLKPSNVLVTTEGRVVILDFGLVKELASHPSTASISSEQSVVLAGSPGYMAPEQAYGGAIGEAADWYAVGVILYKSVTVQLPFAGSWTETLERKQREDAPRLGDLNPDVPADLDEACRHLLARTPEVRSQGAAMLLDTLCRAGCQSCGGLSIRQLEAPRSEGFVGRRRELLLLAERFAALTTGQRQVVLIEGQSGIGKTSLLSHFLAGVKRENPAATILRGRCRESESVPYKALDPIADELVRLLQALPQSVSRALLPRQPELLRRLFPVFGELAILSEFPDRPLSHLDEQQIRRRAFETLCELLGRIADRSRLVISIDDLQWGDLDSISFLAELVLAANAPPLLLILSFRSEQASSNPTLGALRSLEQRAQAGESWLNLQLGGLSDEEGLELLGLLDRHGPATSEERSVEILRESRGSPMLLAELFRFTSRESFAGGVGQPESGRLLSDMIRRRASSLSATARELIEALSVAGEPLAKATLFRTVRATDEDPARALGLLMNDHLVRVSGGTAGGELEPFHDQVREASLSWLSSEELRGWHAHLAELFEAEEEPDPQRLLRHYRGAGNLPSAFESACAAARGAEIALAFDHAARFYAEALEIGQGDEAVRASLHRKRAEALAKAGRGYESGQCYLAAARWPAHNDSDEMRRLAAEQLMFSGYLDQGTRIIVELLHNAGLSMPTTPLASVIRMIALRASIRLRGLRWHERAETEIPKQVLRRLDILWVGAQTLATGNPIFGTYLQARHMLEALRAGEPARLAISLGIGSFYESVKGAREYARGRELAELGETLAKRLNRPYLLARGQICFAALEYNCACIEKGLKHCQTAIAALADCNLASMGWDLGTINALLTWFLGWSGRIRELSVRIPVMLDDARARGDVYAEVTIRCINTAHLVDLAADEPDRSIAATSNAIQQWRQTAYDLQHFGATFARMECNLYAGRTQEARALLLADSTAMRRSLLFRKSHILRATLFYARGRTALAEWLRRPEASDLRAEAQKYAARLAKLRSPWGEALGLMLRAGLIAGLKRPGHSALLLERAELILREHGFRLFAAAALRRRGELEGPAGIHRIEAADAFMRSENIVRPDRMTAMILPGSWV